MTVIFSRHYRHIKQNVGPFWQYSIVMILWRSSVKGAYRIFNYVTQHFKMLFSTTVHSGELVLHLQIGVGVVLIFTHPWECNWFWTGQWTTCGELASLFNTYLHTRQTLMLKDWHFWSCKACLFLDWSSVGQRSSQL